MQGAGSAAMLLFDVPIAHPKQEHRPHAVSRKQGTAASQSPHQPTDSNEKHASGRRAANLAKLPRSGHLAHHGQIPNILMESKVSSLKQMCPGQWPHARSTRASIFCLSIRRTALLTSIMLTLPLAAHDTKCHPVSDQALQNPHPQGNLNFPVA